MQPHKTQYRSVCGKCGARRIDQQIGLEDTPSDYVARLVEVFREVRRVLHPSGTCWINIGDSYNSNAHWSGGGPNAQCGNTKTMNDQSSRGLISGLGPKQLLGIPWRLAFALQADGWILRSEIIWHKLAPMPESVTDRCTKAHEQVFLLAKSERYFFDNEAIREPLADGTEERYGYSFTTTAGKTGRAPRESAMSVKQTLQNDGQERFRLNPNGRNKRSVWTLGPESFSSTTQTSRLQRVEPYEVSDDTICKVSASCPVHGGLFDRASSEPYGVRVDELFSRTGRKRSRRAPKPTFGSAPTDQRRGAATVGESSDVPLLPRSLFAIEHDMQDHRTGRAPATNLPDTASAQTVDRIDDTQERLDSGVQDSRILASNIDSGGSVSIEATQPASRNIHTDTVSASSVAYVVPPECTCSFYHEITENTSHYAVMPTKLVEPCVLAGSSAHGCCAACGAPWERVVERTNESNWDERKHNGADSGSLVSGHNSSHGKGVTHNLPSRETVTLGWQPTCQCQADVIPCTVLDPFCGSGTTLAVALKFGRRAIGIDLDARNMALAHDRIARMQPMLFEVTP